MADGSDHPCCRAIQQNMERIIQTVVYNDIKDKVFAKKLITVEDFEEYDRLTNNTEAVRKMTMKVMHSTTACEEFLTILHEMQQYKQLAQDITPSSFQFLAHNEDIANDVVQIIPKERADEILQEGQTLMDTLLEKGVKMAPNIKTVQLKRLAGKGYVEFLMYIIKLFREAIKNKAICLKNSVRENILSELDDHLLVLLHVREDFCGTDDKTQSLDGSTANDLDNSIAIVVTRAIKVKDIIKSLQKKHWLRWFQSAKHISTLVPIFEKIIKVIEGIQHIDCRGYNELLGDIADLKTSLHDIHKRILVSEAAGLSTSMIFAIGGFICLLVGRILFFVPATSAGVPLAIGGGAAVGVGFMIGSDIKLCNSPAINHVDRSKVKGTRKGKKFVKNLWCIRPNLND